MRAELIALTRDLIRIPSPSLHEKEVARHIDGIMRRLHFDLVFTDDVGNIVGIIAGTVPGATVLVTSHMDTVRPERVEQWNRSPFSGDIVEGRVHGIGAVDCKGSLASQIYAGHLLASAGVAPRGSVVVAATVADAHGCGVGVRHLLQTTLPDLELAPTAVVFGGPTTLSLAVGHDGWVAADVSLSGEVEHSVRKLGRQAVQQLQRCREHDPGASWVVAGVDPPQKLAATGGWRTTLRLDRRLSPGETESEVVNQLRTTVLDGTVRSHGVEVDVGVREEEKRLYTGHTRRVRLSIPPWSSDLAQPVFERARAALREAGCPWVPVAGRGGRPGFGTAGAVATTEFGVPAVGFGPGSEVEAEHCDESVSVAALCESVYGTAVLMCGLSGTAPVGSLDMVQRDDRRVAVPSTGVAGS